MARLKIAVVGVGSFVFGPSILHQVIIEQRLDGIELALVDIDAEIVELMANVGRQMAQQAAVQIDISTHTSHAAAFEGADFVICSVARQGFKRFEMDYHISQRYLPGHLVTEFGGIAGISNSLRQIAMILELADDMHRYCPDAWLLDIANPLPRVCQAAHAYGIKTLGFCSVSQLAYSMTWQIFYGESLSYPFTRARERWNITLAGLNHFVWLVDFKEKDTGIDLLPSLRQALAEGHTSGNPMSEALARETGYLLVPVDDHTRDFLRPDLTNMDTTEHHPFHGSSADRRQRITQLQRIAQGEEGFEPLLQNPSWERPIDVIAALTFGKATALHSLNMINEGQVPNLPRSVFVETPCIVTQEGITPRTVVLPESVLPLCQRTALVTDTIVQAALKHDRALVHHAVELDPTVLDTAAGIRAIDACLDAHADMLPFYK
jgi:alpha-galactosidase